MDCRGKRVGVFGAFLLAIYNEENEEYQAISKIGTGFSEVLLKELADSLREHVIDAPRPYYRYALIKKSAFLACGCHRCSMAVLQACIKQSLSLSFR